jgi:alpha-amylase/alpha-mannosidase (GH57 family)
MLYLAFIFHMHQPYYKDLLTQETALPWVRLHGIKDYLDMVEILKNYPQVHQTFNLVPSLLEQIEDYTNRNIKDKFFLLSYKEAASLTQEEQQFILENFFSINRENVIVKFPRYYELYFKKEYQQDFSRQDYLDLQVWFNLAWTDPYFRDNIRELKNLVTKGRFFTEEEKHLVLDKQIEILEDIIPTYKKFLYSGQVEFSVTPYYHPILPLLYNTNTAKEANNKSILPKLKFSHPEDVEAQINQAVRFYHDRLGIDPCGMWPSEQGVCEHILPFIINSRIKWVVTDEAILFKSLKLKKREGKMLYRPYLLKRKEGDLNIVFRDRNLSDLIGFVYYRWKAEVAVTDFMKHLENISLAFHDEEILLTIAMDGENAWEYYVNDGHDFLELLYERLSESSFVKTTTIKEYLQDHPPAREIKRLAAGSWIYGEFSKWINHPLKNKAWDYLTLARQELEDMKVKNLKIPELAWKQIQVAEGSDWFWWYGDNQDDFDRLYRLHLANFYTIINKAIPEYLKRPLSS